MMTDQSDLTGLDDAVMAAFGQAIHVFHAYMEEEQARAVHKDRDRVLAALHELEAKRAEIDTLKREISILRAMVEGK